MPDARTDSSDSTTPESTHQNASAAVCGLGLWLRRLGPATCTVGGTIAFRDAQKGTTWRVSLDAPGGAWLTQNEDSDFDSADVRLTGSGDGIRALFTSPQALWESLKRGELTMDGELSKLTQLARLLRAARNSALLRAGN